MASQAPQIAGSIGVVISGNVLPGRDLLADENIKPTVNEHNRLKQLDYTRCTCEMCTASSEGLERGLLLCEPVRGAGIPLSPQDAFTHFTRASLWMQSASSLRTLCLL